MADRGWFALNYPVAIAALIKGCKSFNSDWAEATLCVYGAITILWTTFLAGDMLVNLMGNYVKDMVSSAFSKREERIQGILDELTLALGAEVCHLGYWIDETAPQIANLKTCLPEDGDDRLPVLGVRLRGYDFHFTSRGEINGSPLLRFGFSIDDTPNDDIDNRYVKPYFDYGGLDFLFHPVHPFEKGVWKDDDEHHDWLFDQIKCLLGEATLWETKVQEAPGIFFQMYDNMKGETVAAAAVATFGEDGKSPIHEMTSFKGGLEVSRTCMEEGNFDIWG